MKEITEKIDALWQDLQQLLPMTAERRRLLDKKFRLEFNFNSNHLEGNTLTYNETELLLIFDETRGNHTLREYEEMKAHDVAWQLIQDWAADTERPLTETNLKNLNEIILVRPFWKEAITRDGQPTRRLIKVGDYKEQPNSVQLPNGELFDYASPTDTPIKMGELMEWFRTELDQATLHPVALAALFHYKFVCIHPFDDGNGRISRLLLNYVLHKYGYPPVVIKSKDKKAYLSALRDADTGNINAFIQYIAQQLIWSLELSIRAAKGDSIEEPDDLDKEIAVWKKQVVGERAENLTERNDRVILELYQNSLKGLFALFESKMGQFYDLFSSHSADTHLNGGYVAGLEAIEDVLKYKTTGKPEKTSGFKFIAELLKVEYVMNTSVSDESKQLNIVIKLLDYKRAINSFDMSVSLDVEFKKYSYQITFAGSNLEFDYGQPLTSEIQNEIIITCVKSVFEKIKQLAAQ